MCKSSPNTNSKRSAVNPNVTTRDQNSYNLMSPPKFIDDVSKIEYKVAMCKLDIIRANI